MTQHEVCTAHGSCLDGGQGGQNTSPCAQVSNDGCKTDLLQGEHPKCGCDGTGIPSSVTLGSPVPY